MRLIFQLAANASNMKTKYKVAIVCGLLLGGIGMVVAGGVTGIVPLMAIGVILVGVAGMISMTTCNSPYRRTTSGWNRNPLTTVDTRVMV